MLPTHFVYQLNILYGILQIYIKQTENQTVSTIQEKQAVVVVIKIQNAVNQGGILYLCRYINVCTPKLNIEQQRDRTQCWSFEIRGYTIKDLCL